MLYIDASCGAAGDMFVGALIDAGADETLLEEVEKETGVGFGTRRVDRSNMNALKVDMDAGGDDVERYSSQDSPVDGGDDGHDHPHRDYTDVVGIVESTDLPDAVIEDSLAVFERIGRAEAKVHDVPLDELAFHEVGADDAIADVLGATLLFHDLGVGTRKDERAVATPVNVGGGRVRASHGDVPAPVPATVEILRGTGHRMEGGPVETELLTPTGAALLTEFAEPVERVPEMSVDETGYGAGAQEFDDEGVSNVLRVVRGDGGDGPTKEGIEVLETNVDDVSPEVLGSLFEKLRDEGARDVYVVPTVIKKNRPGHLVQVLARPDDAERLARVLARETGTLGVRATPYTHRFVADRRVETVELEVGGETHEADVKIGEIDGEVFDASAEYDDARRIADETGEAVRDVMRAIEEEWR